MHFKRKSMSLTSAQSQYVHFSTQYSEVDKKSSTVKI